jgi:hypothetical protein
MNRLARFVSVAALLLAAPSLRAAEPAPSDWTPLAAIETIQVLSENADGTPHETTVWLAVSDGRGFIRTGDTSWYPNLGRKPEIAVRVDGKEYAVRAELVEDQTLHDEVNAVFRAKYGWSDVFVDWLFPGDGHVVRLAPR